MKKIGKNKGVWHSPKYYVKLAEKGKPKKKPLTEKQFLNIVRQRYTKLGKPFSLSESDLVFVTKTFIEANQKKNLLVSSYLKKHNLREVPDKYAKLIATHIIRASFVEAFILKAAEEAINFQKDHFKKELEKNPRLVTALFDETKTELRLIFERSLSKNSLKDERKWHVQNELPKRKYALDLLSKETPMVNAVVSKAKDYFKGYYSLVSELIKLELKQK